jgi:hypothetical protein
MMPESRSETYIARQRLGNHVSVTTNNSEDTVAYVANVTTFPWQRVHKKTVTTDMKKKKLFKEVRSIPAARRM